MMTTRGSCTKLSAQTNDLILRKMSRGCAVLECAGVHSDTVNVDDLASDGVWCDVVRKVVDVA